MNRIKVLLVGAGSYGSLYARQLAENKMDVAYDWVGVVDPFVEKSAAHSQIKEKNIPVFVSIQEFYEKNMADLAIIATPTFLHAEQSIYSMKHGSHVLLEKPIAGTIEFAEQIIAVQKETGKRLMLGYQWCYDDAMLHLKQLSDSGSLGRLKRMRSLVLWQRSHNYYNSGWNGRIMANGVPVYDCISSNGGSHFLFNMLWLAGKDYGCEVPESCDVFLARANQIETFDTAVMRFHLKGGAELLHVASHAAGVEHEQEPMFFYEYENAEVSFGEFGRNGGHILIRFRNGERMDLGESDTGSERKLEWALQSVYDLSKTNICPAEAALVQLRAIDMARRVMPEAHVFPNVTNDGKYTWVEGLADQLIHCYSNFCLPDYAM